MKNSKKISLFLAIVMILSCFTAVSYATTSADAMVEVASYDFSSDITTSGSGAAGLPSAPNENTFYYLNYSGAVAPTVEDGKLRFYSDENSAYKRVDAAFAIPTQTYGSVKLSADVTLTADTTTATPAGLSIYAADAAAARKVVTLLKFQGHHADESRPIYSYGWDSTSSTQKEATSGFANWTNGSTMHVEFIYDIDANTLTATVGDETKTFANYAGPANLNVINGFGFNLTGNKATEALIDNVKVETSTLKVVERHTFSDTIDVVTQTSGHGLPADAVADKFYTYGASPVVDNGQMKLTDDASSYFRIPTLTSGSVTLSADITATMTENSLWRRFRVFAAHEEKTYGSNPIELMQFAGTGDPDAARSIYQYAWNDTTSTQKEASTGLSWTNGQTNKVKLTYDFDTNTLVMSLNGVSKTFANYAGPANLHQIYGFGFQLQKGSVGESTVLIDNVEVIVKEKQAYAASYDFADGGIGTIAYTGHGLPANAVEKTFYYLRYGDPTLGEAPTVEDGQLKLYAYNDGTSAEGMTGRNTNTAAFAIPAVSSGSVKLNADIKLDVDTTTAANAGLTIVAVDEREAGTGAINLIKFQGYQAAESRPVYNYPWNTDSATQKESSTPFTWTNGTTIPVELTYNIDYNMLTVTINGVTKHYLDYAGDANLNTIRGFEFSLLGAKEATALIDNITVETSPAQTLASYGFSSDITTSGSGAAGLPASPAVDTFYYLNYSGAVAPTVQDGQLRFYSDADSAYKRVDAAFAIPNVSTGKVKLSADVTLTSDIETEAAAGLSIYAADAAAARKVVTLLKFQGQQAAESRPIYSYGWDATSSTQKEASSGFTSWTNGSTMHVEFIYDIDANTLTATVGDETKTFANYAGDDNLNTINGFGFNLTGDKATEALIDNVSVMVSETGKFPVVDVVEEEPPVVDPEDPDPTDPTDPEDPEPEAKEVIRPSEVVLNETFDELKTPVANSGSIYTAKVGEWVTYPQTSDTVAREIVNEEGRGNVLKVTTASSSYFLVGCGDQNGEVLKYSIDLKFDEGAKFTSMGFGSNRLSDSTGCEGLFDVNESTGYFRAKSGWKSFAPALADNWYTFVYEIDHVNKVATAQVFDEAGNLLGQVFDVDISSGVDSTDSFGFYTVAYGTVYYDNAVVTRQEYRMLDAQAEVTTQLNDFEDGRYKFADSQSNIAVVEDDTNKVLKVSIGDATSGTMNIPYTFKADRDYVLEADIKPGSDVKTGLALHGAYQTGSEAEGNLQYHNRWVVNFMEENGTFYVSTHGLQGQIPNVETDATAVTADKWYHVKTTIDTDTLKATTVVTDKATGSVVREATTTLAQIPTGYSTVIWQNTDTAEMASYYDNLKLSVVEVDNPTMSLGKVKFSANGIDGNYIDNIASVSVDANAIKLDFGTAMIPESVNANTVKLVDADGANVEYTGTLEGGVYTMAIPALNVQSIYTLYVSKDVLAVDGDSLGLGYMTEFKTAYGSVAVTSFTTEYDTVMDAFENDKLVVANVTYENKSGAAQTLTFYKAYYDAEGVLLDVETQDFEIANGASNTESVDLTLKDEDFLYGDFEDGTMKIFLWDAQNKALTAVCELRCY